MEHLADTYIACRKSVVPFDVPIGASREDGVGGAERLNREARSHPGEFLRLRPEQQSLAATLLALLTTNGGKRDIDEIVCNLSTLVSALDNPLAFYVRLLNTDATEFNEVEEFFRNVVDPTIAGMSYRRAEMGTDHSRHGFLNVAIFDTLHYASLVIVDVTGLRSNCFIELGYALGRQRRVIVTAKKGTPLPFDQQAIPCFFWNPTAPTGEVCHNLRSFMEKNMNRPPLVP